VNVDGITIVDSAEERTWPAVIRRAGRLYGERPFLSDSDGNRPLSFAALDARTDTVAAGWARVLDPGEPVGVLAPPTIPAAVAILGLLKAGALPVLVSTRYRDDGLAQVLQATLAGTRVVAPRSWHHHLPPAYEPVDVAAPPEATGPHPDHRPDPASAALVLPTSGTTGVAKGAILSHDHNLHYAEVSVAMRRLGPDDGVYAFSPLFHADGMLGNVLGPLLVGARAHLSGPPSLQRFWATCREEGLTTFTYAGGLIAQLWAEPPGADDRRHPVRVASGAPSPGDKARAFEERFGMHLAEGYGSTECGIPLVAPWDASRVEEGSCGCATTGYEVRLAAGGELLVRPCRPSLVMAGYVGDDAASRSRLPGDGWFHTGDLVEDIGGGHYAFRGRVGDAIRHRGEFVPPVLIEQVAACFPGVVEAAAYAVASPVAEDDVALAVTATRPLDTGRLRRHLAERLPAVMVPTVVHVLDELPKSPGTGKVQKHLLPR
jgi:crotonobetaine/carnitine-CoA ligase